MDMRREHSAGAIINYDNGTEKQFLILQYRQGHWDFPRGHIEKGETAEQAARREINEETGINDLEYIPGFQDVNRYSFSFKGAQINKEVVYFLAKTNTKEITLSDEHLAYRWLSGVDTLEQLTFSNTKRIFTRALEFLSTR